MKRILPIITLALLSACAAQQSDQTQNGSSSSAMMASSAVSLMPITSASSSATIPGKKVQSSGKVTWSWTQGTEDSTGVPTTTLKLTDSTGKVVYQTTCAGVANDQPVDGTLAAVRCWWAGGGDEFVVFGDLGNIRISHRTVDEESGIGAWTAVQ